MPSDQICNGLHYKRVHIIALQVDRITCTVSRHWALNSYAGEYISSLSSINKLFRNFIGAQLFALLGET